ncbi:MAG: tRNA pseudouridine(38-40) synthase TruA, partial [Lachnospiraceae bacterium]|nr:tRNA pseudouridine(38-40) synthase TruA [Lachnospiraceae bacterium]
MNDEKMKKAAAYFVGEHDFQSFCAAGSTAETTVRRIYELQVRKRDEEIIIEVTGNGFLYHMVRIIAGTLMEVGRGRIAPEEIKTILEAKDRTKAGPTAVAKGLTLIRYYFEDNPELNKI